MKNQKGFSLIELIVVVAILGVLGAAVFGFIVAGTHSYKSVSDEADLQYNAQLVVNQIENLLVDTTKGLSYSYTEPGGAPVNIVSDAEISGTAEAKTLTIYNLGEVYYITWKDKVMTLRKDIVDDSGTVTTVGKEVKLAKNVSSFSATIVSDIKNTIKLDFIFEGGGKTYTSNKQLALRNTYVVNGSLTDIYDKEPEVVITVDRVTISSAGQDVTNKEIPIWVTPEGANKGSLHFTAKVYGTVLLSEVIWTISGNTSEDTTIEGGTLILASDEESRKIIVTATSKDDSSKSAVTSVVPKQITGITANIDSGAKGEYYKGDSFTVTATVTGTNLSDADREVTWSASGAAISADADGKVTATITASANEQVTIMAISKVNPDYKAIIGPIIVSLTNYKVTVSGVDNNAKLLRNSSINGFKASVTPNTGYGEIKWKITGIRNGSNKMIESSNISLTATRGANSGLRCSSDLSWEDKYTVYVKAYVEAEGEVFESNEVAVSIDKVMIRLWHYQTTHDVTKQVASTIRLKKGGEITLGYEIFGIKAVISTDSNSSSYVKEARADNRWIYAKLTDEAKGSEPKIPLRLNNKTLNYLYFDTN